MSLAATCYGQVPTITSFNPPLSAVGLPVYIAGTNLAGAASVTFNGRKAPFVVDSPELIVALVPLNAETGHVVVTTPNGTAGSNGPYDIVTKFWDALQDFSTASNPNGAWTYGTEPALGGTLTPFSVSTTCFTDGPCWWNGQNYPNSAAVELNTSLYPQHVDTIIVPTNEVWLAPEYNVVVARWTAPTSGAFWIFGEFQALDLSMTDATIQVVENGTNTLYSGNLTFFGGFQTFNLPGLRLKAGTTIDFLATSSSAANDNVGLAATIDQIQ